MSVNTKKQTRDCPSSSGDSYRSPLKGAEQQAGWFETPAGASERGRVEDEC